jgi:hypothetical protein
MVRLAEANLKRIGRIMHQWKQDASTKKWISLKINRNYRREYIYIENQKLPGLSNSEFCEI